MSQLNDCILSATGGPTVNEGLLAWYQAGGATSNALNDAAYEFLVAQGVTPGHINDMWRAYLLTLGIPDGSLSDMLNVYWCQLGGIVPDYWWMSSDLDVPAGDEVTSWASRLGGATLTVPAGYRAPVRGHNGGVLSVGSDTDPGIALEADGPYSGIGPGLVVVSAMSTWIVSGALISSTPWDGGNRLGISPWGPSNVLYGDWGDINTDGRVSYSATPITDRPVVMALNKDGNALALWVDGNKVAGRNSNSPFTGSLFRLFAGAGTPTAVDSEVFEVRIYHGVYTDDQVRRIMAGMRGHLVHKHLLTYNGEPVTYNGDPVYA